MLLPRLGDEVYLGVDRNPFEPDLLPEDLESGRTARGSSAISGLVAPGWRRSLYELVEQSTESATPFLISSHEVAVRAHDILQDRVGRHDLVWTSISTPDNQAGMKGPEGWRFLGYDLAYLGGDFYSAIKNGLIVKPDRLLTAWHKGDLNEAGLFRTREVIPTYLDRFRELVSTESESEFHVYELHLQVHRKQPTGQPKP